MSDMLAAVTEKAYERMVDYILNPGEVWQGFPARRPDPRTPEQKAAAAEEWRRQRRFRRLQMEANHRDALEVAEGDDLALALLNLHSPEFDSGDSDAAYCMGCDYGGYEGESPEFPCRTYELVVAAVMTP